MKRQAKLIAVNLKLMLQFRRYSIHYFALIIPAITLSVIFLPIERSAYILNIYLLPSFIINIVFAFLASDLISSIASKPDFFNLPGYKELPVKIVAVIGVLVNLLYCSLLAVANGTLTGFIVFVFGFGLFIYANLSVWGLGCMSFFVVLGSVAALVGSMVFLADYSSDVRLMLLNDNGICLSVLLLAASWWMISRINYMLVPKTIESWEFEYLYEQGLDEETGGLYRDHDIEKNESSDEDYHSYLYGLLERCNSKALKFALTITIGTLSFIPTSLKDVLVSIFILAIISIFYFTTIISFYCVGLIVLFYASIEASVKVFGWPFLLTCGRKERLKGFFLGGLIYAIIMTIFLSIVFFVIMGFSILYSKIGLPWATETDLVSEVLQIKYFIALFFLSLNLFNCCTIFTKNGQVIFVVAFFVSPLVFWAENFNSVLVSGLIFYLLLCFIGSIRFLKSDRRVNEVGYE